MIKNILNDDTASKFQINPFNPTSMHNSKTISTNKNNLRHLIYRNITKGQEGVNINNSVAN